MRTFNEKRSCRYCGNTIPDINHGSAQYCSKAHAYAARKKRSTNRYHQIKLPYEEIKVNEKILKEAYRQKEVFNRIVTVEDLDKQNFRWGIGRDVEDVNKIKWKQVGKYLYIINEKTKQVVIWPSK